MLLLDPVSFTDDNRFFPLHQLLRQIEVALVGDIVALIGRLLIHLVEVLLKLQLLSVLVVQTLSKLLCAVFIRGGNDSAPRGRLHSLRSRVLGYSAGCTLLLFNLAQLVARLVDVGQSLIHRRLVEHITAMWANH